LALIPAKRGRGEGRGEGREGRKEARRCMRGVWRGEDGRAEKGRDGMGRGW